jgi:hypothetical protein
MPRASRPSREASATAKKPSRAERARSCPQSTREPLPISCCNPAPPLQRTATLHIARRVGILCRYTASMTRGACAVCQLVTRVRARRAHARGLTRERHPELRRSARTVVCGPGLSQADAARHLGAQRVGAALTPVARATPWLRRAGAPGAPRSISRDPGRRVRSSAARAARRAGRFHPAHSCRRCRADTDSRPRSRRPSSAR